MKTNRPHRRASGLLLALLLFHLQIGRLQADELSAAAVATRLDVLAPDLSAALTAQLGTNVVRGSYTTVWRQFEDLAIAALKDLLPKQIPELGAKNFEGGQAGREKNRLADFAIVCGTNTIEISIKAARNSGQPENDLGTFRDHENRKQLFAASFTLWVRYEDTGGEFSRGAGVL